MSLTFDQLRNANVERCNTAFPHKLDDWSLTDWSNAMAGEAGEACNVIKKIRRGDFGVADLRSDATAVLTEPYQKEGRQPDVEILRRELGKEIADIVCYCDLLAARAGIDLGEAVRQKFNEVSQRRKSAIRL